MSGAYEELLQLDPSDSMKRTIERIYLLLEQIEEEGDGGATNRSLELIAEKEKEAVSYYMRPLDSDEIYNRLISLHEARDEMETADHYKSMIDQRRARKWTLNGDLHSVLGDNTLAVKYFERALFYGPRDDVVDEVKKALSKAAKRVDKAVSGLSIVLKKLEARPSDGKLIGDAVKYLIDLNRIDEAIDMNGKILKLIPDDFESLHRKGCLQFLAGEREKALQTFSALKEENPNSTKAKSAFNWTSELLNGDVSVDLSLSLLHQITDLP